MRLPGSAADGGRCPLFRQAWLRHVRTQDFRRSARLIATSAREPSQLPSSRSKTSLPFGRLDRGGHARALRLGGVIPSVPVDAQPMRPALQRQRVEHCVGARIRSQPESSQHRRDGRMQDPAPRFAAASASINAISPRSLGENCASTTFQSVSATEPNAAASMRAAPCTTRSMRPKRAMAASTAAFTSFGVIHVRWEHQHFVPLRPHFHEALQQRLLLRISFRILAFAGPLGGSRQRRIARAARASRALWRTGPRRDSCPCNQVRQ